MLIIMKPWLPCLFLAGAVHAAELAVTVDKPAEMDEWGHFFHGPDNNAVSHDARVGAPRQLRWLADPAWGRSHENDRSVAALVTARGRLFAIIDEAPVGFAKESGVPHQWRLVARDAFNGLLLWQVPVTGMPDMGVWGAEQAGRRIVAVGDRVYATLGAAAPVTELDAATGRVLRTFTGSERAGEILCDGRQLVVVVRRDEKSAFGTGKTLTDVVQAFDAVTGKLQWATPEGPVEPLTAAMAGDYAVVSSGKEIAAFARGDGRQLWVAPWPGGKSHGLVAQPDVVLFAVDKEWGGLDPKTGATLWKKAGAGNSFDPMFGSAPRLFVMRGLVDGVFDPRTGEAKGKPVTAPEYLESAGHHDRCYRDKATDRFIIGSKRGIASANRRGATNGACGLKKPSARNSGLSRFSSRSRIASVAAAWSVNCASGRSLATHCQLFATYFPYFAASSFSSCTPPVGRYTESHDAGSSVVPPGGKWNSSPSGHPPW